MTLSPTHLKQLRECAEKATQGKWLNEPASAEWLANKEANGDHCRAFDPPTSLELLDAIEKMKEILEATLNSDMAIREEDEGQSSVDLEAIRTCLKETFGE